MNRLETRHWIIIAIMVIVVGAMAFKVDLNQLKEILLALAGLAVTDFVVKRVKEVKKIDTP